MVNGDLMYIMIAIGISGIATMLSEFKRSVLIGPDPILVLLSTMLSSIFLGVLISYGVFKTLDSYAWGWVSSGILSYGSEEKSLAIVHKYLGTKLGLSDLKKIANEKDRFSKKTELNLKNLARVIAMEMNASTQELQDLSLFIEFFNIGEDSDIEQKVFLSPEDWDTLKKHPILGSDIASSVPELKSIAPYIKTKYERWDGTGYPLGLKGEEIPLMSRIFAVINAFNVMTSERKNRKRHSLESAIKQIHSSAGTNFDPQVVRVFCYVISRDEII